MMYRIAREAPPPPSQHRPDLDPALEAVVNKALARKPEERYASAREFAAALAGWLKVDPPTTIPLEELGTSPVPANDPAPLSPPPAATSAAAGSRHRRWKLLGAGLLAAAVLLVLLQGIIKITDQHGKVRTIPYGPGEKAEVIPKIPRSGPYTKLFRR